MVMIIDQMENGQQLSLSGSKYKMYVKKKVQHLCTRHQQTLPRNMEERHLNPNVTNCQPFWNLTFNQKHILTWSLLTVGTMVFNIAIANTAVLRWCPSHSYHQTSSSSSSLQSPDKVLRHWRPASYRRCRVSPLLSSGLSPAASVSCTLLYSAQSSLTWCRWCRRTCQQALPVP